MAYLALKYLHILCAIFLVGFGMGSYLYLIAAVRTRKPLVIAQVARMVVMFDTWITTPAGVLQALTGMALVTMAGWPITSGWLLLSLAIFVGTGAIWLPVLVLQKRMQVAADSASEVLPQTFWADYHKWFWLGVVGFAGMFIVVMCMTIKPPIF